MQESSRWGWICYPNLLFPVTDSSSMCMCVCASVHVPVINSFNGRNSSQQQSPREKQEQTRNSARCLQNLRCWGTTTSWYPSQCQQKSSQPLQRFQLETRWINWCRCSGIVTWSHLWTSSTGRSSTTWFAQGGTGVFPLKQAPIRLWASVAAWRTS